MNGHHDYVRRAPQTQLCHWSDRISTEYHVYCYDWPRAQKFIWQLDHMTWKLTAHYSEPLVIYLSINWPLHQTTCHSKYPQPLLEANPTYCCLQGVPGGICQTSWQCYVKLYRHNPKHLHSKLNGYGDNGQRSLKLWQLLHTYWLPNTY